MKSKNTAASMTHDETFHRPESFDTPASDGIIDGTDPSCSRSTDLTCDSTPASHKGTVVNMPQINNIVEETSGATMEQSLHNTSSPLIQPGAYRVFWTRLVGSPSQGPSHEDEDWRPEHVPATIDRPQITDENSWARVEANLVDENYSVYTAVAMSPMRSAAFALVLLALIVGLSVSLTSNNPPSPPRSDAIIESPLAWVANSSVEATASRLSNVTVEAIKADMKLNGSSSNDGADVSGRWFEDERWVGSYQPQAFSAQAWKWLVSNSSVANYTSSEVTTRYALAVLHFQTGGPAWLNKSNWLDTSKHVCDWFTSSSTASYRTDCLARGFTELAIRTNSLVGELPHELGLLTTLRSMNISENRELLGQIPISLSKLTRLRYLILELNGIRGSIPSAIGQLTKLREFSTFGSLMSKPFPPSMCQLSSLTSVSAHFNNASTDDGFFPTDAHLGNWSKLRALTLHSSSPLDKQYFAFDTFPTEIGLVSNLEYLSLVNFRMSGTLPREIGELTKLTTLILSGTLLNGTLPETLSKLQNVQQVLLDWNRFVSTIPDVVVQSWQNVTELHLNNNQFTGTLSTGIGRLTSSEVIDLNDNDLSGTVPTELGLLTSAIRLALARNQFSGKVPSELAALSELSSLDLDGMEQLSGTMPSILCRRTVFEENRMTIWIECSDTLSCDGCCIKSDAASDDLMTDLDDWLFGPCTYYKRHVQ